MLQELGIVDLAPSTGPKKRLECEQAEQNKNKYVKPAQRKARSLSTWSHARLFIAIARIEEVAFWLGHGPIVHIIAAERWLLR